MNKHTLRPVFCGVALLSLIYGLSLFYIEQQFSYLATVLAVGGGMAFVVLLSLVLNTVLVRLNRRG